LRQELEHYRTVVKQQTSPITGARRAYQCRGGPLCGRGGAERHAHTPKQPGPQVWRGARPYPGLNPYQVPMFQAFRDNQRVSVMDTAFAQHLWEASGLRQACQDLRVDGTRPSGLNPNIRIYRFVVLCKTPRRRAIRPSCRYGVGQRFGKHVDDTCEVAPRQHTRYTLLIYLSGGRGSTLQGGETVFYGAAVLSRWASYEYGTATTDHRGRLLAAVVPEAGKALLHLHGDDCLEHEAAVVTRGLKYVLRSDVVFS